MLRRRKLSYLVFQTGFFIESFADPSTELLQRLGLLERRAIATNHKPKFLRNCRQLNILSRSPLHASSMSITKHTPSKSRFILRMWNCAISIYHSCFRHEKRGVRCYTLLCFLTIMNLYFKLYLRKDGECDSGKRNIALEGKGISMARAMEGVVAGLE